MTINTDLLALWAWEYDAPFIDALRAACAARGVSAELVGAEGMPGLAARLDSGELQARAVLDRVWDWGDEYEAHVPAVERAVPFKLNPYPRVREVWNKPSMHYVLMRHGLRVPYMLILPSLDSAPEVQPVDLSILAGRFSVKGAHSGGSGVLTPSGSWDDVLRQRGDWRADETVIQEWVEPRLLGHRRAWFRVFYACGVAYTCWQDDRTHIQQPVTPDEERLYRLDVLRSMTQQIAGLCGLNVFSTEIALDVNNRWLVVDYVNDPCDFRPKSLITNGVPDEIITAIAARIAGWVAGRR